MADQLQDRTVSAIVTVDPISLVESLVDDILDELNQMGTSLGEASSEELFEARYSALDDLLHTDRDPFENDLVAIAHTLQTLAREYDLWEVQEPAQFPDCATTLVETFRAGFLWHHSEAAVTAELSSETHWE